jgi:hypothetical protein
VDKEERESRELIHKLRKIAFFCLENLLLNHVFGFSLQAFGCFIF